MYNPKRNKVLSKFKSNILLEQRYLNACHIYNLVLQGATIVALKKIHIELHGNAAHAKLVCG